MSRTSHIILACITLVVVVPAVLAAISITSSSTLLVTVAQPTIVLVAGNTAGCNTVIGANATSATMSFAGASSLTTLSACLKVQNPSSTVHAVKISYAGATDLSRSLSFRVFHGNGQGTTDMEIQNGVVTTASGPWETLNSNWVLDLSHRESQGAASKVSFDVIVARNATTPLSGVYALYPIEVTLGAT